MPNPKVFFYMTIDGKPAGRIVMGLYTNVTPRTAKNFGAFCTGEKGGGHFTAEKETRGESIYGAKFTVKKHICLDILSMANIDPETIILKKGKLGREEQDRASHGGGGGGGLCITILIADLVGGSAAPAKVGVNSDVWCLETEDVGGGDIKDGECWGSCRGRFGGR
ncbi:hypothetical protein JHK87_002795 [Glycine soja]|nr:hypothetical protein JHK87_002795 [Glycine soja]